MTELVIPPAATRDKNAVEIMRVWIAEQGLHCSLIVGRYSQSGIAEEKAWGVILADAARHLSNAIAQEEGSNAAISLARIREHFLNELAEPTSEVKGDFVSNQSGSKDG
jgi:hypothetical protein